MSAGRRTLPSLRNWRTGSIRDSNPGTAITHPLDRVSSLVYPMATTVAERLRSGRWRHLVDACWRTLPDPRAVRFRQPTDCDDLSRYRDFILSEFDIVFWRTAQTVDSPELEPDQASPDSMHPHTARDPARRVQCDRQSVEDQGGRGSVHVTGDRPDSRRQREPAESICRVFGSAHRLRRRACATRCR